MACCGAVTSAGARPFLSQRSPVLRSLCAGGFTSPAAPAPPLSYNASTPVSPAQFLLGRVAGVASPHCGLKPTTAADCLMSISLGWYAGRRRYRQRGSFWLVAVTCLLSVRRISSVAFRHLLWTWRHLAVNSGMDGRAWRGDVNMPALRGILFMFSLSISARNVGIAAALAPRHGRRQAAARAGRADGGGALGDRERAGGSPLRALSANWRRVRAAAWRSNLPQP